MLTRELLTFKLDTVVRPGQLPVGIRRALAGQVGRAGREFKPANVRQAILLLLDSSSSGDGLCRSLRFVDWLVQSASLLCDDPAVAERLREWIEQVSHARNLPVTAWQTPVEPARPIVAVGTGSPHSVAEDADLGDRDRLTGQRAGGRAAGTALQQTERAAQERGRPDDPQYLVGDNRMTLEALSLHERSLRALGDALERIVPAIFRDTRIKSRKLEAADKALVSVGPLIAALGAAAEEETRLSMRDDLQQLDDDLRSYHKVASEELSALRRVRSEGAAKKPCARLADAAADLLDAGTRAIRHVT